MRKSPFLVLSILIAAGIGYCVVEFTSNEKSEKENEKKIKLSGGNESDEEYDKAFMLEEMYKQWNEMLRDPATGKIPIERLYTAWIYTKKLQDKQKSMPTLGGLPGLVWVNRGPTNIGGRTRTILISPNDATGNTGFAGSVSGGLWKSTNLKSGNPTWQPVNDFLATLSISSIAYDPTNTSIFYAGTGEGFSNSDAASGMGILKSTDGGSTWNFLTATMTADGYYVNKVVVNSLGHVYAATRTGIFRSKDKGVTWEKVLTGIFGDIEVTSSGTFFASGISYNNTLAKSTTGDLGSWTNLCSAGVGLPSTGTNRIETAVAPNNPNQVYTVFFGDTTVLGSVKKKTVIYSSSNSGVSFVRVGRPKDSDGSIPSYDYTNTQGWYNLILKVDPNNSQALYTGGIDLFKSTNGGSTWAQISHWYGGFSKQYVHADQHGIEFEGTNSNVVYFTNDGGIAQTTNGIAAVPTINTINTGYIVTQFYACAGHPDIVSDYFLAGSQDNGTQKFTSPGLGETIEASPGDGAYCNIDQSDPTYQFTQYVYNNFYRSNNTGENFDDPVIVPPLIVNTGRFINPSDYDENTKTMYSATNAGQFLRWTTATTSSEFKRVKVAKMAAGQVSAVTASTVTPDKVYFGTGFGQILSVSNASTVASPASPKILGAPASGYVNCIWEDPSNGDHLVAVYSNYSIKNIWETTNASAESPTWTPKDGNLPDMPVFWVLPSPTNNKQVLVATELGVYSTDNFDNANPGWQPSSDGMANVRVTQIRLRPGDNMVYASTYGRGLFTTAYYAKPTPIFSASSKVVYTGKSITYTDQSLKATSWQWDLNGDGTFDNTSQNPGFTYYNAGVYNVKLRINGDPSKETTMTIHVQPDKGTPYNLTDGGNFEVNANDFAADNTGPSAFYRGNSTLWGKDGVKSGSFAWVIDPDKATYRSNSTAYLYSPSFNCTATGNYTFSFYTKYMLENTWDGFRIEYSTDKGTNWKILGNAVQANWYDYDNPESDRPFPQGEAYFSADNATTYLQKIYTTNVFQGNPAVAFRIVFKADPFEVAPGVAIDDITLTGPTYGALPVSLISFTGTNSGYNNLLSWKSATEIDNDLYEVERSFDGSRFERIGAVKSANNATGTAYKYTDDISHIYANNFYYRLKMVDKDRRYSYSPVIAINVRPRSEKIAVLGNLTNSYINIITPLTLLQKPLQADVCSMNGSLVKRVNINSISSVVYVDRFASGKYSIRFIQDGKVIQTEQFVKQ